jgi:hypothetical protein
MTAPTPAPGWYPDPNGAPQLRYWNGQVWTDHTASAPIVAASSGPSAAKIVAIVLAALFGLPTIFVLGVYVLGRLVGA